MSALDFPQPDWKSDDVVLLEDTAIRYFNEKFGPHYEKWEEDGAFPRSAWEEAGAAGFLGASMPEDYGGSGGTFAHEAAITHAICVGGYDGFGAPLHNAIVAPYILNYGSEEQKKKWLPKLASGELIGAIAMTEPGTGSDLQNVKTRAKREGNQYTLSGQKTFITNGQLANLIIVVAKTDPDAGAKGTSLIVVETDDLEGFRRGRNLDKLGLHSNDTSELFFDDVRVPTSNLLGADEGQGFVQLMTELPQERLLIAVQAMGMIERALTETISYVKDRKAFGQRILDFQNTQFVLAECKTEATIARNFVDSCIGLLIDDKLDATTASMAKYWVTDLQCKLVDRCLQLFGGYGFMNEYPIARMFKDSRVQRIYGGTNEIMKVLIARSL